MASAAADRNLLFGILAVQMDFVRADQLIAAMNAWVLDKQRPLADHLLASGALASDARQLLDALVDKHIALHGGRADASLAALSSVEPLRRELAVIPDSDVQQSLGHAAVTPRGDRHATVAVPSRKPTSPGLRFHILRPHAAGGLGKVSIARDDELNREVALKELHDRHADNPDSRARFLQEAEITGGLEHPGVVPIYGLGQYADGRPFYAMRFIRGDSLAQAIDRFHREADPSWRQPADVLQLRRLLARFLDVCNAIDYAHSRGVLHRDLKPGNIMLGQYGETIVVDWGLAKPVQAPATDSVSVDPEATQPHLAEPAIRPQSGSGSAPTQMGAAIGTPAFMSPEQAAGRLDELSGASDVYSLGATLYVILTGRAPQDDDDLGVVLQRVARGEFPKPRAVKPIVPRGLEAICLKAMALNPRDRYPSPRALADDIEAWLADEPVSALPESVPMRAARWVKNHRTLVTSGAAMALVAAIALAAGNVQLRAANDRERDAKTAALAAQKTAEAALKKAEAAQAESQRQIARNESLLELARKSLDRYETLSKSDLLASYGMESLRSDLLEAAVEFYDALAAQTDQTEVSRQDRGEALFRLAGAHWQLGRMDAAQDAYKQAIAQFRQLSTEFPRNASYQQGAAVNASNLAELLIDNHRANDAGCYLADAAAAFDLLRQQNPTDVKYAARRAYVASLAGERFRQLGQMEPAAAELARAIEILQSVDLTQATSDQSIDVRYRLARAPSFPRGVAFTTLGADRRPCATTIVDAASAIVALPFASVVYPAFRRTTVSGCIPVIGVAEVLEMRLSVMTTPVTAARMLMPFPVISRISLSFTSDPWPEIRMPCDPALRITLSVITASGVVTLIADPEVPLKSFPVHTIPVFVPLVTTRPCCPPTHLLRSTVAYVVFAHSIWNVEGLIERLPSIFMFEHDDVV